MFEERIAELEKKALSAAAETDTVVAKRLGGEVASETSVLQRDLAYAEYLEVGGTASLPRSSPLLSACAGLSRPRPTRRRR